LCRKAQEFRLQAAHAKLPSEKLRYDTDPLSVAARLLGNGLHEVAENGWKLHGASGRLAPKEERIQAELEVDFENIEELGSLRQEFLAETGAQQILPLLLGDIAPAD